MEETMQGKANEAAHENEGEKSECGSNGCGCGEGSCNHGSWTKHRGNEEMALAFLLALTPLVVLTFFGQVGLL
jgi:hypothetical protein